MYCFQITSIRTGLLKVIPGNISFYCFQITSIHTGLLKVIPGNICLYSFQITSIRTGLLKVIPQAVLDLLTWQELENRISGDPDISLEALKRSSKSIMSYVT